MIESNNFGSIELFEICLHSLWDRCKQEWYFNNFSWHNFLWLEELRLIIDLLGMLGVRNLKKLFLNPTPTLMAFTEVTNALGL